MHPRITLSTANFFTGLSDGVSVYILLPFLAAYMPTQYTGLVLATGSLIACLSFFSLPRLISAIGAQQSAILLAIAQLFAFVALATKPNLLTIIILVIIATALQPFLVYMLDVLLEATVSQEGTTGRVRTLFLTAWNVAEFGAPLLMGALLVHADTYGRVFLASAASLMPIIVLFAARKLPKEEHVTLTRVRDTLAMILENRDITASITARFILGIFYTWAAYYVPLYLHNTLGISWVQLGWMFSAILLPFLFIEYPAGWLADNWLGDKELMFVGFIIIGVFFGALGFLAPNTSIWIIFTILLLTRVGAALVESMVESHFFRRVSSRDAEEIAAYRVTWPLTNLIAPLIGSALLFIDGYSVFFLVTGAIVLFGGTMTTLFIRDFR